LSEGSGNRGNVFNEEGNDMQKGKRTDGKRKTVTARKKAKAVVQQSTPESRTKPKTYEVMQVDSDMEAGMVRMTAREIFEENCPGERPDTYEGMEETLIHTRMHQQATRLTVLEDKWHPADVTTVADACTDYVLEFRQLKRLDTVQLNKIKVPTTPVPHGR
jgi:hypothetical protein